jgi:predicted DNA-binding transcriptional regulator AlpA
MAEITEFIATTGDRACVLEALAELPAKTILDANALAAAFGVSLRTLKRWIQRGDLPAPAPIGGKKVWMAGRILAFVESRIKAAEAGAQRRADAAELGLNP